MNTWRITKYNPKYRDCNGVFHMNEWTSFADIGKTFKGDKLTYDIYINTENAYVRAVKNFMNDNNVKELKVTKMEKYSYPDKKNIENDSYFDKMIELYNALNEGVDLDEQNVESLCRLTLREFIWCEMETEDMFVHFGYDYYMYIGSLQFCQKTIDKIIKSGLFVEKYESPYRNNSI